MKEIECSEDFIYYIQFFPEKEQKILSFIAAQTYYNWKSMRRDTSVTYIDKINILGILDELNFIDLPDDNYGVEAPAHRMSEILDSLQKNIFYMSRLNKTFSFVEDFRYKINYESKNLFFQIKTNPALLNFYLALYTEKTGIGGMTDFYSEWNAPGGKKYIGDYDENLNK